MDRRPLRADYDDDPARWRSWQAARDVHDEIGPELRGTVLDIGCGHGRLAERLTASARWVGIDASPAQVATNRSRPLVLGDMRSLPFASATFAAATHLWCLYHVEDPEASVAEAARVLKPGGRYYACTSARDNDPELVPEGYPATTFDADDALGIVASVFHDAQAQYWSRPGYRLATPDDVRAYCRSHFLPPERADSVTLPLRLTKRGVLIRATKP